MDRAKTSFNCYDCQHEVLIGKEFSWDNLRNCRLCEGCLKKLSDIVEGEKKQEAAPSIAKSDSERITALEEQVQTLGQQMLHLKSFWYNEIRTLARQSHDSASRQLTGHLQLPKITSTDDYTPEEVKGFKTPSSIIPDVIEKTEILDDEECPF
jgi:hypothetical protein